MNNVREYKRIFARIKRVNAIEISVRIYQVYEQI